VRLFYAVIIAVFGAALLPVIPASAAPKAPGAASAYTPVVPVRIMDTRTAGGALGAGATRDLVVTGASPLAPAGATAVVLNVTVTNTTAPSFLTVYPAGSTRPLASNLNWLPGTTVPNLVEVPTGTGGAVTFYNLAGSVDVIADLQGYFTTPSGTAGGEVALTPARITDTRSGSGYANAGSGLSAGGSLDIQVTGQGGVPASGVAGVILNATVTNTTAPSFLTVWPTGAPRNTVSNLNWMTGDTIPNRVFVPVGSGGKVSVYSPAGTVDVIIDVGGYFTSSTATGAAFTPQSPVRIADTRVTGPTLGPGSTYTLQVGGTNGVPANASAVILNVTTTNTTAPSFLTVYPSTATRPFASDLNWLTGVTRPNLTVATLGSTGAVSFYSPTGSVDVIADLFGYFGGAAAANVVTVSATPSSIPANGLSTSAVQATVTNGGTAVAGDTVSFSVGSASPAGACGTVSPTTGTSDVAGHASTTYTSSHTAGTCVVTATESAQSQSGTATITQTSIGNQTYTVTPGTAANQAEGSTRAYTVAGIPAGQLVNLWLFNCNNVQNSSSTYTFTGTNPGSAINNNAAQGLPAANATTITLVNGTAASGTQVNGVTPAAGVVTFTITNADTGTQPQSCVTPVAFQQPAAGNNLALGANNQPSSQAFGVGGNTTFNPAAPTATTSVGDVFVQSVDKTAMTFVGCKGPSRSGNGGAGSFAGPCYLLTWKSSDNFFMRPYPGVPPFNFPPSNQAEFTMHITPFDMVDVNCDLGGFSCRYSSDPATPNYFGLSDSDPVAPADNPSAVTANAGTSGGNPAGTPFNTVIVKWTDSISPTTGSYNVYRASWVSPATACPAASAYAKVGTVADSDPTTANGATTYSFTDAGLTASTNYCYKVSAVDGTDEHIQLAGPTGVAVGTAVMPQSPISTRSVFTQGSNVGNNLQTLDTGDVLQFTFVNGPITAAAGASISVADFYSATATLTNGGNATFSVNSAGDTLSITITGLVVVASAGYTGDPTPTAINTNSAGRTVDVNSSTGISSTIGAWNLAASGCANFGSNSCFTTAVTAGLPSATRTFRGTSTTGTTIVDNNSLPFYIADFYVVVNIPNTVKITGGANSIVTGDTVYVYNSQGVQIGSAVYSSATGATITTSQAMAAGDDLFVNYKDTVAPSNTGLSGQPTNQISMSTELPAPSPVPAVTAVTGSGGSPNITVFWNRNVTQNGPASDYTVWNAADTALVATGTATSGSPGTSINVTLNAPLSASTSYRLHVAAASVGNTATGDPNVAQNRPFSIPGPVPAITSITPTNGPAAGGTTVVINGSNLAGVTSVTFCTTPNNGATTQSVTPTSTGATTVTAVTPSQPNTTANAACAVTVTAPGGTSGSVTYTFVKPAMITGAAISVFTREITAIFDKDVSCVPGAASAFTYNETYNGPNPVGTTTGTAIAQAATNTCLITFGSGSRNFNGGDFGTLSYLQPGAPSNQVFDASDNGGAVRSQSGVTVPANWGPISQTTSASASSVSVTVTFDSAVLCTTLDANGSDFSFRNNTTATAKPVVGAVCSGTIVGGQSFSITLTLGVFPGASTNTYSVTAKLGTDLDTVTNQAGLAEPVGDAISGTLTA
jgi:hypothetical protein